MAAFAAGTVLVSGAAQAQQNVCQGNIAQVLSEHGVKLSEVADPQWQALRWAAAGRNGPVSGYQFYGRPASRSSGSLNISVTTGCEISDMHTEGGSMIKGVPNYWW
ncbi:MAG: hypothetical protein IPK66_15645 [Rhodospirillales bacterium]|nr:hypothetical protein [Rhodospirillales bacterium]